MRTIDEIKKDLKRTPRQDMGPLLAELYAAMMVKAMSAQPSAVVSPTKPSTAPPPAAKRNLLTRIITFMSS